MTRPPPDPPPYRQRHTAADPSNVVTETEVPNEQKALPSQKGPALMLAFGGAAVALLAVILDWMELDTIAVILAVVAVLMTVIAVVMALNDVRTGAATPILCAIVASIVLLVTLLDVLDADEAVEDLREENLERLDTADDDVPADPADIIEGGE